MLGVNNGVWSPTQPRPSGGVEASGTGRGGGIEEYLEAVYTGVRDSFAGQGAG